MVPRLKYLCLVLLVFFISGCSGYIVCCKSLSDLSSNRNSEFSGGCDLEPGDDVRVHLHDGEIAEGNIESVSPDEIVLGAPYGDSEPRVFVANQISSVEKKSAKAGSTALGVIVIGTLVVALAIGISNMSMGL
jgi:hypothetical protein